MTLAFAAPAAAQGAVATPSAPLFFGAGISFLVDDEETLKGFSVNVSKDIMTSGNLGIGPVGDFGFHTTEGFNVMNFAGGIRLTANMPDAKVIPFGQFLIGATRFSGDLVVEETTRLTFLFGGGVHVPLNDKWNFLAQIDFVNVRFDGASATDPRLLFGVSTKIGG